ncbi:MAG: hypothetical protein ACNS62_23275 [Candidatus Cyclobacteriaceae bacterium M3_2C_046]
MNTCLAHISTPILINPWKHHLAYGRQQLLNMRNTQSGGKDKFSRIIQCLGNALFDIYLGPLSLEQITQQLIDQLDQEDCLEADRFEQWLVQNGTKYQMLTLTDQSVWAIRKGLIPDRYVHIHPARHAPHTLRVKSQWLKTAYAVVFKGSDKKSLKQVNQVRQELVNLPPVKSLSSTVGLGKIIHLVSA